MAILYYDEYLKKQDSDGKWRPYHVLLNANGLHFYSSKAGIDGESVQHVIELTPMSRCVLVRRQMHSFRFKVVTDQGSSMLKCDTMLERYRWMYMIDLVVTGRSPEIPPLYIPVSFYTDSKWKDSADKRKLRDKIAVPAGSQRFPKHYEEGDKCISENNCTLFCNTNYADNQAFWND